ncbi:bifunctional diaminohydroxyphosphoribosylaminopyrimidine deaminase/5-amino-6-(5-phosphoribosylamino)uracil reductase RibD [Streptomyces sp. S1D4-20]|uniref:bifunctional diaminohydroxyphosphoribosylaminopyrimidine deaminase/5-amino-6-(5-phosphoribosylamino)uracil reductase RibD n=1 Tax=Streptomyces sp. S1D4-20 TaxID=2594462 RepID=UPI0011621BE0|nr:bifunctional diaminohydroxyphosphoribosylaminopyrimidine deaminase/5-amino-6-(5-phosphoribosylamino)uracil reductase RibD [Streptomyces sp. S1D4-20]QDN54253.1 bifunctional diaminohydroxyphosphoribosylaminopyrimidine deaminase/5-amino-6-(5-phosphoribosylamino)uracil reductase RibD [Streptomyces sp. S1D4-20]
MPTPADLDAMRRAIIISASGLGTTSPNPPVGCVILNAESEIVGEGYHLYKGAPHAEVNALAAAGVQATGGTAVVTLEPCNHVGLTPACHRALLDAGIARVLIAVLDPTSREEGGAERLRRAGVEVETHVLEGEALVVLGAWHASLASERPVLHVLHQVDADGSLTAPSPEAVAETERQRQTHDLVICPEPTAAEEGRPGEHGLGVFHLPGELPPDVAEAAVAKLAATGARSVLLLGPSKLSSRLIDAGFVDRLTIFRPAPPPSRVGLRTPPLTLPPGFVLTHVTRVGMQLLVTAEPRR